MGKYLRKFENHAAYEAAQSGLILPNVSLCVQEGDVHYNPFVDPYAGHDYVDLGLPSGTKWATMNVGASSITDYGNYYQYGRGSKIYQPTNNWYTGTENPLAASADTATQVWGGSWHMPTSAQCQELIDNTTYEWTTIDGVNGCKFTANGQTLFIPAAGIYSITGTLKDVGINGIVWCSTPFPDENWSAYRFVLHSAVKTVSYDSRRKGVPVRPVVG